MRKTFDTYSPMILKSVNVIMLFAEAGEEEVPDRLMFHPCCGTHADVINNGRTAHRPK